MNEGLKWSYFVSFICLMAAMNSARALPDAGVENHPSLANVKFLKFHSDLLGRDTTTRVFLPPNYAPSGESIPALYWVHGTSDYAFFDEIEPGPVPDPPNILGRASSGVNHKAFSWFEDPQYGTTFVVVYPDVGGGNQWCGHCWWVDGRNGQGVAAESYIYQELIPLIEQKFNVHYGRNGRAISGHSMGGNGTLLQAFRHPDWWRFALAFSPTQIGQKPTPFDVLEPTGSWFNYLADQGYGDFFTDEVHYQNIEPMFLTENVIGSGIEVLVDVGNGCMPPDNQDAACAAGPEPEGEFRWRHNLDVWTSQITEQGVDLTYVARQGRHSTGQTTSYRRFFYDRVKRMFATPVPTPAEFSYSTVDIVFSVWGWGLSVERPTAEFLHLSGARTDGTAITLAGTGVVTVTTPPLCGSAEGLQVLAVPDGIEGETVLPGEIVGGNRLRFTVNLGARVPAVDQHRALVESGKFNFPRTRIRLVDSAPLTLDSPRKLDKKPPTSGCP